MAYLGEARVFSIGLVFRPEASNVALLLVKAGERGVETPLRILGRQLLEAGWHARMSSRLAGKGACACS
jgi:hypothetical protein